MLAPFRLASTYRNDNGIRQETLQATLEGGRCDSKSNKRSNPTEELAGFIDGLNRIASTLTANPPSGKLQEQNRVKKLRPVGKR